MSAAMTPAERKLLAHLLRRAADVFCNHGCGDVDLGALGISDADACDIDYLVKKWNGTPAEHNREDVAAHRVQEDWVLMRWLAATVEGSSEP